WRRLRARRGRGRGRRGSLNVGRRRLRALARLRGGVRRRLGRLRLLRLIERFLQVIRELADGDGGATAVLVWLRPFDERLVDHARARALAAAAGLEVHRYDLDALRDIEVGA